MWTKRERVLAVLSGEKPDRVPIFECLCHDGVMEHFGGQPLEVGDLERAVRASSGCLDLCHPQIVPQAPQRIEHEDGSVEVIERWTAWTTQVPAMDPSKMRQAMLDGIDEAEAWRPGAAEIDAFRDKAATIDGYAGDMVYIHLGSFVAVLPFGMVDGCYAWADHPELVERWNQARNQRQLRYLDAVADAAASPVCMIWNDIACKNRLLSSPAILEKLFYPHLAAQVDLLHSRGIRVLFHSDGQVTDALAALMQCGIDGLNPLEISAGMAPATFKQICGRRVALVGGIDAVDVLAHGTPDLVARKTRELIDLFRDHGNLMMASASGEVDNSMPTENVLAMYETTWDKGVY